MKHALLSASSAARWINCPPSARLCEGMDNRGSNYTAEGTDAHSLCEWKLKSALGYEVPTEDPAERLTWYNTEMEECASGYADYVLELVESAREVCPDPEILIEQRVDFSRWVPEGYGTADCIIAADGTLNIIDYKHGQGVLVEAKDNPQMLCYALGALELFDALYDIERIRITVYQPRKANIASDEWEAAALWEWAETVLKPRAELAFSGEGDYCAGEWCRFCPVKTTCRKRSEAQLELARYEFKQPPLLTKEEIEELLPTLDALAAWASDIKDYALKEALNGTEWQGWKLVEGRSVRKYTDDLKVASAVLNAGYDPYEKKLIGLTAMQKMLGKVKFEEVLCGLIERTPGKLTLVPEGDKRPATTRAKHDFKEEN